MARAGLSRLDIKRARDSLIAQRQHPSIDAIRIALGNTGSKTTIHRYLKELEEEEGTALNRAGSTSDAILDLIGRLAARLHEEAQAVVDQQTAAAATQRQQVRAEADKLAADLAALRTELEQTHTTLANVRATHSDTQAALGQRTIEAERLAQQVHDLNARLAEHEGFRRSLEEKLQHAHLALEHFRNASKEQRDQDARRHEQQVQQLQAETRHANQALIVKQGEITQLNKEGARLVAELAASAKSVRSLTAQADQARAALSQAYIDQARIEAERDGLRSTAQQQADALAAERAERERLTRELAGVTARLDAQEQVLAGYRAQLGVAGPAT
ncbi:MULTISPECIES: DNA-binding protein [Ralstonia]|jgi:chromosome segregation ATPase|uniref:DNA-binding protein n=1 Tax=Ralstonia TaxID=48736 RepID=UPI0015FBF9D1|nr:MULTISPECIES: DNA-binding protein [Ralstonia]MEA3270096.1 DNA-binding protein [Pseudomonadota bacterium]MBB0179374.1 DNA-binding protein [Ralstonia pickettii]MBB0203083.1 DNA-binding protein [Ralstonia pickettii]MBX3808216.1 DNA-binding protein [Ralstonia pickettii]MBX3918192.1 DNA-binding protein [Ralstonia pickettii]